MERNTAMGLVFLLQIDYNVDRSGGKWILLEENLREMGRVAKER